MYARDDAEVDTYRLADSGSQGAEVQAAPADLELRSLFHNAQKLSVNRANMGA
jgi:hypothetical protein